jgi:hypothetical protein
MATLNSPGVSVTVVDESFYTPAAPGTTPLIIVASAENKRNSSNSGTAPGTLKANAGQVYLMTGQKDLVDTFGTPVFNTDANNNPIHAGEQNEYGLQAAYSYLGVSNRAYVVRADLDLTQLTATTTAPTGAPTNGTFWFDTANTLFGVFEWNAAVATTTGGQTFTVKYPTVITDASRLVGDAVDGAPKSSVGAVGDYAIVATTSLVRLYYKKALTSTPAGAWVLVGSSAWAASWATAQGAVTEANITIVSGDTLTVNGVNLTGQTSLDGVINAINSNNTLQTAGVSAAKINSRIEIYSTGVDVVVSGSTAIAVGLMITGETSKTYKAPTVQQSSHTQVPLFKRSDLPATANGVPTGSVWIKTTAPNLGSDWIIKKYSSTAATWQILKAPVYANSALALAGLDVSGGGINLPLDTLYVKINEQEEFNGSSPLTTFKIYKRAGVGATTVTSVQVPATGTALFGAGTSYSFTVQATAKGSTSYLPATPVTVSFVADGSTDIENAQDFVDVFTNALLAANVSNVAATYDSTSRRITITHKEGGDIKFDDQNTNGLLSKLFAVGTTVNWFNDPTSNNADGKFVATLWATGLNGSGIGAVASATAPTNIPADGTLWYNSDVRQVDILIHNGTDWVGFQHPSSQFYTKTDPRGPIVAASAPTKQSDGSTALATGDLWIDTSDLENYPKLYKYNGDTKKWVLVDKTDQTTENGILFADARWATSGDSAVESSITDLLASDYLDTDAPDPALYPKGMMLWNLRRSGFNVKRFARNFVDTTGRNQRFGANPLGEEMVNYYPHRWVSEAANQENGAGTFGRKAQRKVVVQKLQALVNSNQQIRDEESRIFNLIACPGYPELIGEMVSLNVDRGLTAFVVGDTPARLQPSATVLTNWGNNINGAVEDGDEGLVTSDEYLGVFYPWGFTTDNLGNNIVVPPSHMMLRTIALSDNVSYPWFAPAGTRRGGVTNASAVGYVDGQTGEFQSVALNNGQRDALASIKVNPITFITGTGLVNYGQYTRARNASALDRINVARLVIYLRRQFSQLAKPYVFEPNDKITRDELKGAAESLLLELVGQRALYDYIVVCDTSNNTPARIDRNELYLDVAIEPVKAVEFIYIPLRLKNTGEIEALG